MKACSILLLAAAASAARLAPARVVYSQIEAGPPVKIVAEKPPKGTWMRGEVVSFTAAAITIREPKDPRKIHTFAYSMELRDKIVKLMDSGGYQYGDKVKIQYNPQTGMAIAIRGKPSKPD